jgi:protein tyrosine phosphatase (PTP) superfamily phosphohydrolase (DUF442 family)
MPSLSFLLRLVLLALLFAVQAPAEEIKTSTAPAQQVFALPVPEMAKKGLPNFAKVSEVLYRGAQPDRKGFEELKKLGVKSIVNLRAGHPDKKLIEGLGFRYFSIPANTWDVSDSHSAHFLKVISDPANQPVFVHCQHGSDRTGTMVAIYRIYVQNWKPDEALKELPSFGFHKVWRNLKRYLLKLDVNRLKAGVEKLEAPKPDYIN